MLCSVELALGEVKVGFENGFWVLLGMVIGKTTPKTSQKPPTLTSPIVMLMHAQQVTLSQSTTGLETNYIHCTTLQSAC